jgi:hypothetical protein
MVNLIESGPQEALGQVQPQEEYIKVKEELGTWAYKK